jgi:hypothetical protein
MIIVPAGVGDGDGLGDALGPVEGVGNDGLGDGAGVRSGLGSPVEGIGVGSIGGTVPMPPLDGPQAATIRTKAVTTASGVMRFIGVAPATDEADWPTSTIVRCDRRPVAVG